MTRAEAIALTERIREAQDELRAALLAKGLTPEAAESVLRALRERTGTRGDGGAALAWGAPWAS